MTEHKMRVIDGIRYRPEDAPEARKAEEKSVAKAGSAKTSRGRSTAKEVTSDGDSSGTTG